MPARTMVVASLILLHLWFSSGTATPAPTMPCTIPRTGTTVTNDLAGMLGGTGEDFEALLGTPSGDFIFTNYALPGCDTLLVTLSEGDIVLDLVIRAPRADWERDWDPEIAAEGDWTLEEAEQVARSYLPSDATLGEFALDDRDWWSASGFSETLRRLVPELAYDETDDTPTYGGFTLNYALTDSETVSMLMLELLVADG